MFIHQTVRRNRSEFKINYKKHCDNYRYYDCFQQTAGNFLENDDADDECDETEYVRYEIFSHKGVSEILVCHLNNRLNAIGMGVSNSIGEPVTGW